MGRDSLGVIAGLALLVSGGFGPCLVEAADQPSPPAQQAPAAPTTWSPRDISRHIDALDRITDTTARTNELIRILVAIMSVPDAGTRQALLDRLRPHFASLEVPSDGAASASPHD